MCMSGGGGVYVCGCGCVGMKVSQEVGYRDRFSFVIICIIDFLF